MGITVFSRLTLCSEHRSSKDYATYYKFSLALWVDGHKRKLKRNHVCGISKKYTYIMFPLPSNHIQQYGAVDFCLHTTSTK